MTGPTKFPYTPETCPCHRWWRVAGENKRTCSLCNYSEEDK